MKGIFKNILLLTVTIILALIVSNAIFGFIDIKDYIDFNQSINVQNEKVTSNEVEEKTPVSKPENGAICQNTLIGEMLCPFKVEIENKSCVIKLTNATDENEIITIYAEANTVMETNLPPGKYNIKYAIGYDWYGWIDLFGEGTDYFKSDKVLEFNVDAQGYHGNIIKLEDTIDGNMNRVEIDNGDF